MKQQLGNASLPGSFILLFLGVGILLKDVFFIAFWKFVFSVLIKKEALAKPVLLHRPLCYLYRIGRNVCFQCWTWVPKTFGIIPAVNPPMGAVFFYAGGDVSARKNHYGALGEHNKLKTTAYRLMNFIAPQSSDLLLIRSRKGKPIPQID